MNMKNLKYLIILIVLVGFLNNTQSQDTVRMSDFNVSPDSRENAVLSVQKALEVCRTKENPVLVFSKGRYDFWPQHAVEKSYYESNSDVIPLRRCAILVEKMKNLTIDALGSDFIFHDRIQPFTIDNSDYITIKNVSIDWEKPLTGQAQIVNVCDSFIDLRINILESPYVIENHKIIFVGEGWKSAWNMAMEFDSATHHIAPETGDPGCLGYGWEQYSARELSDGLVRISHNFVRKPAVGNYLVMRHSARDHAGTFIFESKNISIENLNMYHNAGLGILSQYSDNISFKYVNSVPNASKNRYFCGHDDGLHFSNCRGEIKVDSCRFLGLMDDPINVHGTNVKVVQIKSNKILVCEFMHHQAIGLNWANAGEKVGFIDNEPFYTFAKGIVESFNPISSSKFEITFKDAIPKYLKEGHALENLSWTPDVHIKNSFFGSNRARGILISSPGKIIIEDNVFESSGSAILIAGDANQWYESGAVKDVIIRNNVFNDACLSSMYQFCEAIITILPIIPSPDINKPFHKNIRIENNTFHPFDYPVLYAKSVEGISFSNNTLIRSKRLKPFHQRLEMLTFEYCNEIKIVKNSFIGDVLGKNIKLISTNIKELNLDKKADFIIEK